MLMDFVHEFLVQMLRLACMATVPAVGAADTKYPLIIEQKTLEYP